MVALPVLIARLPFSSARVWVGPPLFLREESRLISAEVFVVAQSPIPGIGAGWVMRLLAAVEGEIRFTVPVPS